jgi:hypothetical protein
MTIKEMQGDQFAEAVDNYVVLYRKDAGKYVAKVLSVDTENKLMRYEIMTGENKGSVKTGKYVPDRPFKLYNEDTLAKALLEV